MLPQVLRIGSLAFQTYTLLIDLSILIGLGAMAWRGWQLDDEPVPWLDAGLWAVAGGVLGGRAGHIFIHWAYFAEHVSEILAIWQGGINWHGAIAGGILGLYTGCLIRHVNFRRATDLMSLVLPVGAVFAYAGCLSSRCGYGQEVVNLAYYHPAIAAELPDVYGIVEPRLQTQLFGLLTGIALLGLSWLFSRRIQRPGVRFWIILTIMGLSIFLIDFTRGDSMPLVGVLRLDQYLDVLVAIMGLIGLFTSTRSARSPSPKSVQRVDAF
jgi:phosphatidylglycerol:prolipoprotein diacylglycerol transferase